MNFSLTVSALFMTSFVRVISGSAITTRARGRPPLSRVTPIRINRPTGSRVTPPRINRPINSFYDANLARKLNPYVGFQAMIDEVNDLPPVLGIKWYELDFNDTELTRVETLDKFLQWLFDMKGRCLCRKGLVDAIKEFREELYTIGTVAGPYKVEKLDAHIEACQKYITGAIRICHSIMLIVVSELTRTPQKYLTREDVESLTKKKLEDLTISDIKDSAKENLEILSVERRERIKRTIHFKCTTLRTILKNAKSAFVSIRKILANMKGLYDDSPFTPTYRSRPSIRHGIIPVESRGKRKGKNLATTANKHLILLIIYYNENNDTKLN